MLIDAYDSFVHIIGHYIDEFDMEPLIVRSQEKNIDLINAVNPAALILGPGPGHPDSSGHVELVRSFAGKIPILGVCLGHQAIAVAYGAEVVPASHIMHGKTSMLEHDQQGVFCYAKKNIKVTRYHSLVVREETLPSELIVSSRAIDDGYVMGLRHRNLSIESVQFHPESVTTEEGNAFFRAFFATYLPSLRRL